MKVQASPMSWLLRLAAFVGGVVLGVAGWFLWLMPPERERSAAELMDIVMWGREPIGGPFTLTDHNGQRRTDVDFRGKLLLVYFGFIGCSDVCPTDLQSVAVDKLGHTGDAVQPLFITVNPELDTPEQLKDYVALFHPRTIGLTGSRRQIAEMSRAYKVYSAKTTPGDRTDPNFDHSSLVYVVGTDGKYVGFFPPGTPADRMVEFLRLKLAAITQTQDSKL
jgi:protein SCO1